MAPHCLIAMDVPNKVEEGDIVREPYAGALTKVHKIDTELYKYDEDSHSTYVYLNLELLEEMANGDVGEILTVGEDESFELVAKARKNRP